jgi:hypothetical protein
MNTFIKNSVYILILSLFVACFSTYPTASSKDKAEQPVVISNDSIEYQIIIMDPGFTTFLYSIAKPKEFYSNNYYQSKNIFYVSEWNMRVRSPMGYSRGIFEQLIDYDSFTDYGLEVNYKLFNYFKFEEYKYRINFNVPGSR